MIRKFLTISNLIVFLVLSCFGGCAQKPIITNDTYLSPEHLFQVKCPSGWTIQKERPQWFPAVFTKNNPKDSEQMFFVNPQINACVMIESHDLLWESKKVHPIEILQAPYGRMKFMSACFSTRDNLKKSLHKTNLINKSLVDYSGELGDGLCFIEDKCRISTVHLTFKASPEFFSYQAGYIVGKKFKYKRDFVQRIVPAEEIPSQGWDIYYLVYAPTQYEKEAMQALKKIISNTKDLSIQK